MRVRFLGPSPQNSTENQYVTSCVINGTVAIDAGCLGFYGTPPQQEAVRHVFLTHSHSDHVASLAIFLENVWTPSGRCPRVYGSPETLDVVKHHIFNDVMSPNFG